MQSFFQLWEKILREDQMGATGADQSPNQPQSGPPMGDPAGDDTEGPSDEKSMEAIRTGQNIRDDFWDDFIQLTNNADAVAQLLGVRTDQVTGWASKVKNMIDKVHDADKQDGGNPDDDKGDGNSKVLPTGPGANVAGTNPPM
jgi:hypothetical protein